MAKLTLKNGVHKVAELSYDIPGDQYEAGRLRVHFVLRSDNKVLAAYSSPDAEEAYDRRRSSYAVRGTLKQESIAHHGNAEAAFLAYVVGHAKRRGVTVQAA